MSPLLDIDQLRTFIAIAETGSFTRAAEIVHKTQSAVSMKMKRLEERVGCPIFSREGRASRLTDEGERLLDFARRIIKLNAEAVASFANHELSGRVRLGIPDDYAERYLPEVMARFTRVYPGVELTILCEPSLDLVERLDADDIDLAIITSRETDRASEIFRQERLLWATSSRHAVHLETPLPLALSRPTCNWRIAATGMLDSIGRSHRLLFCSGSAAAIVAAVLAGLAVSVFPESTLRPGMRVLTPAEGFPELPPCRVGLLRNPRGKSPLIDALAGHVISSLDNLSQVSAAALP
jgi:DNA-binding transcriptional LysR family regulator